VSKKNETAMPWTVAFAFAAVFGLMLLTWVVSLSMIPEHVRTPVACCPNGTAKPAEPAACCEKEKPCDCKSCQCKAPKPLVEIKPGPLGQCLCGESCACDQWESGWQWNPWPRVFLGATCRCDKAQKRETDTVPTPAPEAPKPQPTAAIAPPAKCKPAQRCRPRLRIFHRRCR